ncbi:MAG TPA: helix-turn-helix domain-containing protein [Thermomicrobiales bacterium]|jgi:transcriptional regulator with XRE-family HTH domain
METFGERLQRLRAARGISQSELARKVGWTSGYVSLIEANKRLVDALPRHDYMLRLAEVLGVDVAELTKPKEPEPGERRRLTDRELFEKFGIRPYDAPLSVEGVYASAGPGEGVPHDIDDSVPREYARRKYLREVTVRGDCMVPDLYPGEVVVYNIRLGAEIGKIMVALRDEEELLVKRLVLEGDDRFLHPNEGMNIRVDERIRFLGRAVAVTRRLL